LQATNTISSLDKSDTEEGNGSKEILEIFGVSHASKGNSKE
jgi:hypothetical protein